MHRIMELKEIIENYYEIRGLKWPDIWEALAFAHTEMSEVYEIILSRNGGWTRNHPENKPEFSKESLSEELGDSILMLLVAGYVEGVNPIQSLKDKISKKLEKINAENNPTVNSEQS